MPNRLTNQSPFLIDYQVARSKSTNKSTSNQTSEWGAQAFLSQSLVSFQWWNPWHRCQRSPLPNVHEAAWLYLHRWIPIASDSPRPLRSVKYPLVMRILVAALVSSTATAPNPNCFLVPRHTILVAERYRPLPTAFSQLCGTASGGVFVFCLVHASFYKCANKCIYTSIHIRLYMCKYKTNVTYAYMLVYTLCTVYKWKYILPYRVPINTCLYIRNNTPRFNPRCGPGLTCRWLVAKCGQWAMLPRASITWPALMISFWLNSWEPQSVVERCPCHALWFMIIIEL